MPAAGRGGRTRLVGTGLVAGPLRSLEAALRAEGAPLPIVSGTAADPGYRVPAAADPPTPPVAPPVAPPAVIVPPLVPPMVVPPDVMEAAVVPPEPLGNVARAVMPTRGIVEATTPALVRLPVAGAPGGAPSTLGPGRGLAMPRAAAGEGFGAERVFTVDMGTAVLWPTLTMMSPNCSGSLRRPSASTGTSQGWPAGAGGAPSCPAGTSRFWLRMAAATSPALMPRAAIFCGSSQARML